MSRLQIIKPVLLMLVSLIVTGCIYDNTEKGMPGEPQVATAGGVTSNADKAAQPVRVAGGGPLGGYIEQFMDVNDKSKMTRALDGGLGKASRWTNPVSGAQFAMTPVSKVSMGSNICRSYLLSMNKGGIDDKVNGTACIGEDGIWHSA